MKYLEGIKSEIAQGDDVEIVQIVDGWNRCRCECLIEMVAVERDAESAVLERSRKGKLAEDRVERIRGRKDRVCRGFDLKTLRYDYGITHQKPSF